MVSYNALIGYTDNCGGTVTAEYQGVTTFGTDCNWTVTYSYSVKDNCGNTLANQTYSHSGKDQTIPVISLNGLATVSICQGATYTDDGATASDNCAGIITASIIPVSNVNTAVPGNYTVTYNVEDPCGNDAVPVIRTVIVMPKPTATISGTTSICFAGSATLSVALTGTGPWTYNWSDDGGTTTHEVTAASSPSTFVVSPSSNKTYTITSVTDATGCVNVGSGQAKVYIGPITTIPSNIVGCPGSQIEVPVTVSDFNNVGAISLTLNYNKSVLTYSNVFINNSGLPLTVDYDESGASGVIIIGGYPTPPSNMGSGTLLTLKFNYLGGTSVLAWNDIYDVNCEYGSGPPDYVKFCDDPASTYYINGSVIPESTLPTITCPANAVVNQHDEKDPFATGYATATDNCAGSVTITYDDNRNGLNLCNATGVILRTWKATDAAGNIATCVQTITVQDVDNPIAICPSDITTTNDLGNCSAVVNYVATATDFGLYQGFENPSWLVVLITISIC
ncbi:MAG: DUF5011 domain-containing protein [Bacteroidales bacterium]|nr:DUF5011 domain-containing protein [Bacteroidales bacterium]